MFVSNKRAVFFVILGAMGFGNIESSSKDSFFSSLILEATVYRVKY